MAGYKIVTCHYTPVNGDCICAEACHLTHAKTFYEAYCQYLEGNCPQAIASDAEPAS